MRSCSPWAGNTRNYAACRGGNLSGRSGRLFWGDELQSLRFLLEVSGEREAPGKAPFWGVGLRGEVILLYNEESYWRIV